MVSKLHVVHPNSPRDKNNTLWCISTPIVFGGCCFYLVELRSTKHSFAVRPKNSPPDCFLNGLTILQEIITALRQLSKNRCHQGFRGFLFCQCSVWCKFGASLLIVGTHAKKVFTNSSFYDTIKLVRYLIDKLEFDGQIHSTNGLLLLTKPTVGVLYVI